MCKLFKRVDHNVGHESYIFRCPACKYGHQYIVKRGSEYAGTCPEWSFNGDLVRPTFSPSLLVRELEPDGKTVLRICHLFLTDGMLHFQPDCTHELAGQIIPL